MRVAGHGFKRLIAMFEPHPMFQVRVGEVEGWKRR